MCHVVKLHQNGNSSLVKPLEFLDEILINQNHYNEILLW